MSVQAGVMLGHFSRDMRGRVLESAGAIESRVWDSMWPGAAECSRFYRAIEAVPISDAFRHGAIAVYDEGTPIAAAPLFQVNYRLDTPLQGGLRRLTNFIHARVPQLVSLPVLALGSPITDTLRLGFRPHLDADERLAAAGVIIDALEEEGRRRGSALVALKSLAHAGAGLDGLLAARGYARVTSVPLAVVDLPFASRAEYLASLPKKNAAYLRSRTKTADRIRFEEVGAIGDMEPSLHALLEETVSRSAVDHGDFDRLHPNYFAHLKRGMGDNAMLTLCWSGPRLIGFQLSLIGRDAIIAKHIGVGYPEARELNLYFVNWLRMVDVAIARGVKRIELGGTTYATKLMLGARLERRWLYYRICNGALNRLLRPAGRLFDFERNDPELRRLKPEQLARLA